MKKTVRRILAVAVVLLAATGAAAQVGGLRVVVRDSEGALLPGATVTISHELGYLKTTSELTDEQGVVHYPVLRPGSGYKIQVSFPGFSPLRYEGIRVRMSEQQTLAVQMIEELEEQVRVTAERGLVDLDKSEISTKFSDEFITDLPVLDRFYQNVLVMAPGVQDADGDGNPNVHGSRARDFQAVVSGVSNVDPLTGKWLSRVSLNSIEEMEVITAGAGVEFGRAQGGFARIIQKQGSNRHEGIVEFYWQTSKLDGDGANDNSVAPAADFDTYLPGFQFSGPLVRDKLWYRVSYERRDREEPVDVVSGIEIYTHDSETRDAQLTWQVSPRNKLALQYRSDPLVETNFGISSRIPIESSERHDREVDTYSLNWTAAYSPRVLFQSTAAWQRIGLRTSPSFPGVANNCVPSTADTFLRFARCTRISSFSSIDSDTGKGTGTATDLDTDQISGSFPDEITDQRQRFTVKSQATIYAGKLWGANHQFKLGINVENERYFRVLTRSPSLTYQIVPAMGFTDPFARILSQLDVPNKDQVRATGMNWAFYAEDQIKPAPNLTITLGVRVDREELDSEGRERLDYSDELARYEQTIPLDLIGAVPQNDLPGAIGMFGSFFTGYESFGTFEQQLYTVICADVPAISHGSCVAGVEEKVVNGSQDMLLNKRLATGINIRNTNISPFLSVAWSPWNDGKTAIKVSGGRHYNNIPLIVPMQELEPVRTTVEYRADLVNFQPQIPNVIKPFISVTTVDPDIVTPYQDEFTFSLERELWPESSIRLTYINRKFRDQIQDRNVNVQPGDYGRCASISEQLSLPLLGIAPSGVLPSLQDATPGRADGQIDDCAGRSIGVGATDILGSDVTIVDIPDGFPDLYVQSPFWGGVFEVGNHITDPRTGLETDNKIDYEALVLELVRRQYRSWEMNASYTYSEAKGDGEDFFQELGRDPSLRGDVEGFQSYDQRHVVKLNATTITPWGVRMGTAVTWQSGLPFSILREGISDDLLPPSTNIFTEPGAQSRQSYPTGTRNGERNDSYWNVDLQVSKQIRLGQRLSLQVSAEVFNVLDDDTYQIYNPFLEAGQRINEINEAQRRFGRHWQVGMKIAF